MKKVLVTGINGLIGQYIAKPLQDLEFEVYGVGTKELASNNFNYIKVDINNILELKKVFEDIKPQYLIHLAWDTKKGYLESTSNFDLLYSSIKMLELFKDNGGKKAIFIGTCFEYKFKDESLKETDEVNPTTIYAKTKNYLREVSEIYSKQYNIDFCWGRVFYVYGENENYNRLFPHIINSLRENKKVSINYSQIKKDYMCAYDIARAIALLLKSNTSGIINLCTSKAISLKYIAETIANKLNKAEYLELKQLDTNEPSIIVGDNSRLVNEVGFNEFTNIDKWLDEYLSRY